MKVKVRLAVAVDEGGNYCASGWTGADDDEAMGIACDAVDEGELRYWLEAVVEAPEPNRTAPVITPTITEAK